jgi:hypothetical protein
VERVVAKIRPPLEEKQLPKLFLNTHSLFYYKKMVTSAPNDLIEMVGLRMRLGEGVWKGRLVKENAPASSAKRFENNYPRKREQKVNMVTHGGPQSGYLVYPHIAAISPSIPTNQRFKEE